MTVEGGSPRLPLGAPADPPCGPILAVELGTAFTRAYYLDRVDGLYRFVARSQAPVAGGVSGEYGSTLDQIGSVQQAVSHLSRLLGRRLLDESGSLLCPGESASGVDALVAVSSVQPSPRSAADQSLEPGAAETPAASPELAAWNSEAVSPSTDGLARSVHYLARLDGIDVLGVDLGWASASAVACLSDRLVRVVRPDLGLGARALVEPEPRVPFSHSGDLPSGVGPRPAVRTPDLRFLAAAPRPDPLGVAPRDARREEDAVRDTLHQLVADLLARWPDVSQRASRRRPARRTSASLLPRFDLIVGRVGALAHASTYGHAALALLDGLQPAGIFALALDSVGLLPVLGALAARFPLAAAQVMGHDGLLNLGTVVALVGGPAAGELAVACRVEYCGGRVHQVDVPCGAVETIPLPPGRTADLELRPGPGFDAGLGIPGQAVRCRAQGGVLGILVDARGRPLPAPS